MRTKFLLIFIFLFYLISVFSQSYYYQEKKIELKEDPQRVTIVSSKGHPAARINLLNGVESSKTITDTLYEIVEFKSNAKSGVRSSDNLATTMKNTVDNNTMVLPCYRTMDNEELVMTNCLNIRLKKKKTLNFYRKLLRDTI